MSADQISIEKLVHGGYGMGRLAGKAVFVPYSALGDLLEVEITEKHRNYDYAKIQKIIKASEERAEPCCKYFGTCGGCHLQHINYAAQILWKQLIVEEQISRIGCIEVPPVLPVIPSPIIWGYRNRIQIHRQRGNIGYCERESSKVIDVTSCPIADDSVNKKLREVRKKWPSDDNKIEISSGRSSTFAQVNSHVNKILKEIIVEWAKEGDLGSVLELYAGDGNLTFELADIAGEIVAIDADRNAVGEVDKIIKKKGITNIQFIFSTAGRFLKRGEGLFNLVVTDPPRDGLGADVVKGIAALRPARIIYVSCDPSTLARDIKSFVKDGYQLIRNQPLDMFPETYHIESVSYLQIFPSLDGRGLRGG